MMLEKLLRRFVSKETDFVLNAMEVVGGDPDATHPRQGAYENMIYAHQISATRWVDLKVVKVAAQRLERTRKQRHSSARAQEIAGKILLGDDFVVPEEAIIPRHYSRTYPPASTMGAEDSGGFSL